MDTDTLKRQEIGRLDNTNNTDLLSKKEKNEELVEFITIEETPFTIVKQNDIWCILMGKYLIEKGYETKEEAEKNAKAINWDKLLKVVLVLFEELKKE